MWVQQSKADVFVAGQISTCTMIMCTEAHQNPPLYHLSHKALCPADLSLGNIGLTGLWELVPACTPSPHVFTNAVPSTQMASLPFHCLIPTYP